LREDLLNELRGILHRTEIPAIYVTHDQEEAFMLADRLLILLDGAIIREGTPAEVWANPQTAFVAGFLALGNVIVGEAVARQKFRTGHGIFTVKCTHKHVRGEIVHLLARPQPAGKEPNIIRGVVNDVVFQQDRFKVTFDNGLYLYLTESPGLGRKIAVKIKVECLG